MAIQSADKYDAVLKAIDAYGTAQWAFGGARHNDDAIPECRRAREALNKAIDAWATARDAAIRAEAIALETQRADHWRKEWVKSERARASSSATQPEPEKEACQHDNWDRNDGTVGCRKCGRVTVKETS